MNDTEREHLASNIVGHATNAVTPEIQERVVEYWTSVDADLGARVAAGIRAATGGPMAPAPPTHRAARRRSAPAPPPGCSAMSA